MVSSAVRKYVALCLICLCSSLLFLGLYQFNNKYSQDTIQAANGILVLSERELQQSPLRFLVSGWAFYPDALLSPEEIRHSSHYMRYLSIGEQTNFSSPANPSPYGCGTYQMTLFLPERKDGYALEIPEVFSAYTLYLNDDLILQMGKPASGTPLIQNRIVTFYGGEPVTLTMAVSNYDHFYGGIIYPPAFGTMIAVSTSRGIRFAVCLFVCTIMFVCALLAFYFSKRMKQKNTLLFGLICLAMCGLSSYPVLHMLAAVPVFPWYALELFCIYLAAWLIVILQNRICKPGFLPAAISNGVGAAFCVYALGYGMIASHLSLAAIRFFSASVFCYKAACALYLLITAVLAIHRGQKRSKAIFYATVAATCAFVWNRLLPVYEPVIGGWFVEWSSFFLAAAIGYSLWRDVVEGYGNSLVFQEERKQVIRQLSMQTEYSRQIAETAAENRRLIHDIKHHLRTIDRMAAEHGQSDIRLFLSQVEEQVAAVSSYSHVAFCQNPAVNALIEYYYGMMQTQGTEFQVRLDLPDQIPLTDVELCTVLGNLLDNSVEACGRQKHGARRILVAGETRGSMYFLKVENTYNGQTMQESSLFLSRKGISPYHGIGLSSVRKIIESHGGDLDIIPREGVFLVGITIGL
ncbi:MAG: ATP-binding protein [Agathobaculum sp.]|uniref:ATP-binding protein n=1 Tax=Agathobaculum sp. TaxID=2048138 RepID=UPI0025C3FFD0|nr:ATP-binding protein [Agathobaculum sp.]MCI7125625.1 ATP-binding protein [Agathobaculum sp.]